MVSNLAEILTPAQSGRVKLDCFEIGDRNFAAAIQGIPSGKYVRLVIDGETAMSNTPMEIRTNWPAVHSAFGDVLIGGLGIGMILLEMQNNPKISSITVIEKSPDVIKCVGSQLPLNDKVKIVEADIFTFKPRERYDFIWLDIWNCVNSDVWEDEMKPLKRKYARYLKPKKENSNRCVLCWAEWQAKNNRRLY